jgi:hypothetical protein
VKCKIKSSLSGLLIAILILLVVVLIITAYFASNLTKEKLAKNINPPPQGLMILIESTDEATGLLEMVSEMKKRDIYGLLMITPEFVSKNCEDVKKSLEYGNIEIVASNVGAPFWNISYEEQKSRIAQMLDGIQKCTGEKPRIISSRYMASDMNTIKAAEELGVTYITARGTTGSKATVYQPEGYNIKILSVSNIPLVSFEYGSLCDYSFYERAGSPNDMKQELMRAIEPLTNKEMHWFGKYHRITPVSHTYIGGHLKQWNDMWIDFWDNANIKWVTPDEFMSQPDWTMPLWQIPTNKNNPYTEEKIRPLIPYEKEEKVKNMCAVVDDSVLE